MPSLSHLSQPELRTEHGTLLLHYSHLLVWFLKTRSQFLAQAALEFTVLLHWPAKYRYKRVPLHLHTLNVMRFLKIMTSRGIEPSFTVLFTQIS